MQQIIQNIINWFAHDPILSSLVSIILFVILKNVIPIIWKKIYKFIFISIWPILLHSLKYKKHKNVLSYFTFLFESKNLKSEYQFIDHASRYDDSYYEDYEEEKSCFMLDENKSLFLEPIKDINEIVSVIERTGYKFQERLNLQLFIEMFNNEIREEFTDRQLNKQCIGVSYFMHNRDQRKEKDEAHWIKLYFFQLDLYTRLLLDKLFFFSFDKERESLGQPQLMNTLYPFLTACKIFCNVCYKGDIMVAYYQYQSHNSDYHPLLELCFDDLFLNNQTMSLKEVKLAVVNHTTSFLLSHNYNGNINNCYITDIGIENGEITFFSEIRLSSPLDSTVINLHSITMKEFLSLKPHKLPKKLYHSLSNIFIRNS